MRCAVPELRSSLAIALVAALVLKVSRAGAEPLTSAASPASGERAAGAEVRGEAEQHFRAGLAHAEMGEWQAAHDEFDASYRLVPTASALANAALSLQRLGRAVAALKLCEQVLRESLTIGAERCAARARDARVRGALATGSTRVARLVEVSRALGVGCRAVLPMARRASLAESKGSGSLGRCGRK